MKNPKLCGLGARLLKNRPIPSAKSKKCTLRLNPLYVCLVLLSLLYIFHACNNLAVLKADSTPIMADSTVYYQLSVKFFRILSEDRMGLFKIIKDKFYNPHKPPLFAFSVLPWYSLFGIHPDNACMSNLLFLAILIISIFFIGRDLCDDSAGLLAAFILTTYPVVFGLSRWCMPYFASISMVSLAVMLLIKSRGFASRGFSLLSGVVAGLAATTHLTTLFSLFVPYLFFFLEGLRSSAQNKNAGLTPKNKITNLLLSLSVMAFLILGWLFLAKGNPYSYMAVNNNLPRLKVMASGLSHFINLFLDAQIHWFYAGVFIISGGFLVRKRPKLFLFFSIWYIAHTVIVSCFPYSWTPRFNIASLIAIALASSLGISAIPWKPLRRLCLILIIIVGVLQYLIISYYPYADRYYPRMLPLNREKRLMIDDQVNHYGLLQANKTYWNQDEMLSLLLKTAHDTPGKTVNAWILYGKASICGALRTRIATDNLPIEIINAATDDRAQQGPSSYDKNELLYDIVTADYILTYKKRVYNTGSEKWGAFLEKVRDIFYENIDRFREIARFDMPDGNIMYIYKNTG